MSRFGENVRAVRELRGWSQAELSAALADGGHPMSVKVLSRLERGDRRAQVDDLLPLCRALEVTVDFLIIGGDGLLDLNDHRVTPLSTELRELRRWKREASWVLSGWDRVFDALGHPGRIGEHRHIAALAEVERMRAELARLRATQR